MTMDPELRSRLQLVWGVILALTGVGLLFRIPQVMPRIREIESFAAASPFITFCFYFMAAVLIGGGVRKIYAHFRRRTAPPPR